MKKRAVCFMLVLAISSTFVLPAMAYRGNTDVSSENVEILKEESFHEYMDEISTPHTITFERSEPPRENNTDMDQVMMSVDNNTATEVSLSHNERVAEEAKAFVLSLGLADEGLGFIEEACLEELEAYSTMEDAQLISYTVHVPKDPADIAPTASVPAKYTLFGTYGGRDFYFYYPSSASVITNICEQTNKAKLQQFMSGALNVLMVFADIRVSAAWAILGVPSGYTVQVGAKLENYCQVDLYTRGIYTLYGNGTYQMVTSQQYGDVFPYMVFHTAKQPDYPPTYTKEFGYKGQVYSSKYKNSQASLCKEAWQAFNGSVVLNKYDKVDLSCCKQYFQ